MDPILIAIIKIAVVTTLGFLGAGVIAPLLTHFLYKYKLVKSIRSSEGAPIYFKYHQKKGNTPTMGGIMIWLTTLVLALLIYYLAQWTNWDLLHNLNFLSRSQTWLPLGALVAAALVGLVDDLFNVKKIGPQGGGLRIRHKLLLYLGIAIIGALWFYFKLDWDLLHIPFLGDFQIGWWYIPIFVLVIVATSFSLNETDGLDGLAGGVVSANFLTLGTIAFMQGRYDLAAFCGVIVGTLLAFLWFNIPPARFFMGDTGSMALGVTLGIVALLTNTIIILPIMAIVLVIESLSVIIQVLSKMIRKKKVFLSAPWHHHLEAIGWPESKIVMRLWVVSLVASVVSLIVYLVDVYV